MSTSKLKWYQPTYIEQVISGYGVMLNMGQFNEKERADLRNTQSEATKELAQLRADLAAAVEALRELHDNPYPAGMSLYSEWQRHKAFEKWQAAQRKAKELLARIEGGKA